MWSFIRLVSLDRLVSLYARSADMLAPQPGLLHQIIMCRKGTVTTDHWQRSHPGTGFGTATPDQIPIHVGLFNPSPFPVVEMDPFRILCFHNTIHSPRAAASISLCLHTLFSIQWYLKFVTGQNWFSSQRSHISSSFHVFVFCLNTYMVTLCSGARLAALIDARLSLKNM